MTLNNMEERLDIWMNRQHGTAGWQIKLARFIENEIEIALKARDQEIIADVEGMNTSMGDVKVDDFYGRGFRQACALFLTLLTKQK